MPHYECKGFCPICEKPSTFSSDNAWYRDRLLCSGCGSIPRERALALVLDEVRPGWRSQRIHESSPAARGISLKMQRNCAQYIGTQFFPEAPFGETVRGFRNENLERLTFSDNVFDIFVSLDVMEHVNSPEKVFAESARTLATGGICIFTTPTYKNIVDTQRRAAYNEDGSPDYLGNKPEFHGNPVSDKGSLVTFHYGYDLPELIKKWSGMDTHTYRFHDHKHGIIGEFTEVYVSWKRE